MRRSLLVALSALAVIGAVVADAERGSAAESGTGPVLAVTLTTDAAVYRADSPIILSIAVRNRSQSTLKLDRIYGLDVSAINGRGERVPTQGREYSTYPAGTVFPDTTVLLGVGASYSFDPIPAGSLGCYLYPGTYGLTVSVSGRGFSAGSNIVWITILGS
jgi:hypothetical protein